MRTAFVLTNGNMGGTAGDATLILRRAKAMYSEKGYYTQILLLNPVKQGEQNCGDFFYSIDTCKDINDFRLRVLEEKPQLLILYGDKIQMMTKSLNRFIKKNNLKTKLVLDIQGAVEEKKEYSDSFLRKHIIYPISVISFRRALKNADAAFVVSDEIRDKCESAVKSKRKKLEYYKIRCGFENLEPVRNILKYREDFRKKRGISDDTIVFCYSGYRAPWQNVDEIIEHFRLFNDYKTNCYFAFFCNTDPEFEDLLKTKFPAGNYCVELLNPEDYFQSLCGCDVGYILRDYNETNRVAFPNKFSDYLSSGLIIALNNALPEPMRLIKQLPSHYIDTDLIPREIKILFDKIENRKCNYNSFVSASLDLGEKELVYDMQVRKLSI